LLITGDRDNKVDILINDINGKQIYYSQQVIEYDGENTFLLDMPYQLSSGVYIITATSKDNIYSKRLIVK